MSVSDLITEKFTINQNHLSDEFPEIYKVEARQMTVNKKSRFQQEITLYLSDKRKFCILLTHLGVFNCCAALTNEVKIPTSELGLPLQVYASTFQICIRKLISERYHSNSIMNND